MIGVLGALLAALVKSEFDKATESRAKKEQELREKLVKEEQDRVARLDFLRRMRAVHSTVAYAQWLIRAHRTRGIYIEQFRQLMLATAELWEIHEDLLAARSLFEPDDSDIRAAIRDLIAFLDKGTGEYETTVRVNQGTDLDGPLPESASDEASWLAEFLRRPVEEERQLPEPYESSLDQSKGKMRHHIYGSMA